MRQLAPCLAAAALLACGIACAQAAGTREMAGTMTKAFIHGRSAQNELLAALLGQQGFTVAKLARAAVPE